MTDHHIHLNDEQVNKICACFEDKPPPRSMWGVPFERVIKSIEILALVLGGAWALYQFVSFGRHTLDLQQQILQHDVAIKNAEAIFAHEKQAIEKILLETRAEAEQFKLDNQKSRKLIRKLTLTCVPVKDNDDGSKIYLVTYRVDLRNNSEYPIDIHYITARPYIGTLNVASIPPQEIRQVNGPGVDSESGSLSWKEGLGFANAMDVKYWDQRDGLFGIKAKTWGGTGRVPPTESTLSSNDFFIRAFSDDWFAIYVDIGVDDYDHADNRIRLGSWHPIRKLVQDTPPTQK